VFVVHFVRSTNGFCVFAIGISKQLKPLVNENIVHQKVGPAVGKNTQSNG
jgi:hypothetical protein